jgi:hypothetical protein
MQATSPNEFIIFPLHHANIDRSSYIWQRNAVRLNSSVAKSGVMWGYPANASSYSHAWEGTYLHDTISSNFPFTHILPYKGSAVTHADMLALQSGRVYTYDNLLTAA